jgi:hypothetical protein
MVIISLGCHPGTDTMLRLYAAVVDSEFLRGYDTNEWARRFDTPRRERSMMLAAC